MAQRSEAKWVVASGYLNVPMSPLTSKVEMLFKFIVLYA